MIRAFAIAAASLAAAIIAGDIQLSAAPLNRQIAYRVDGAFAGKKPGKAAKDLSGVACMPVRADGSRLCLFVNDESHQAQFAIIKGETIVPGATVDLIGEEPGDDVPGSPPDPECPAGDGGFGEFDGEGIAYAAPYFYITGSHGCSRNGGEFRLSSFLLARIKVDAEGRPVDAGGKPLPEDRWGEAVELTYRLSEVLQQAETVGAFFGKSLDEGENGLNIEGLEIDGEQLLVGLRAPTIKGRSFIVAADIATLFKPGHDPVDIAAEVIPIALGEDIGIRDLVRLPDGRLAVLAGPMQEQELAYRIYISEPKAGGAPKLAGQLDPVEDEDGDAVKPEALALLGADNGELRVLVLFDGMKNGGPVEMRFPLP